MQSTCNTKRNDQLYWSLEPWSLGTVFHAEVETKYRVKVHLRFRMNCDSRVRLPTFWPWSDNSCTTLVNSQFTPWGTVLTEISLWCCEEWKVTMKHLHRGWNLVQSSANVGCCCWLLPGVVLTWSVWKVIWGFTLLKTGDAGQEWRKETAWNQREHMFSMLTAKDIYFIKLLF